MDTESEVFSSEILDLVDELLIEAYEALGEDSDEPERRKGQWAYSIKKLQGITPDPAAITYLQSGLYDLYDVVDCVRRERTGEYTEVE